MIYEIYMKRQKTNRKSHIKLQEILILLHAITSSI